MKIKDPQTKWSQAAASVKSVYEAPAFEKTLKWSAIFGSITVLAVAFFRDPATDERKRGQLPSPGALEVGHQVIIPQAADYLKQSSVPAPQTKTGGAGRKADKIAGPVVMSRPRQVKIPPGSIVKAVLLSGASNGIVRARTIEPLSVAGERLIEANWILVGTGSSTEERLFINFNQMVTPDGEVVGITGQAVDSSDQTVGLRGSKVSHYATRFVSGAGLLFLAGMAQGLQDQTVQMGVPVDKPSVKNALLQGTQNSAVAESQYHLDKMKNETPIIEVPVGTEIFVLMTGQGS